MANIATLTNPATVSEPANNASTNASNVERRCENADCNVIKMVSMVPKRKITQFITEPKVMEKPMLINGFTTVFQVDGVSAKLKDLKGANGESTPSKTIYRIVPNTHAHIVNYVVVDGDGDPLRKINESDPATMRKLLESQKLSADQMLKKLTSGHGVSSSGAASSATTTATVITRPPLATSAPLPVAASSAHVGGSSTSSARSTPPATVSSNAATSSAIQLPMRVHPNLKITAVASADTIGTLGAQSPTVSVSPALPVITPVPLANLQSNTTAVVTGAAAAATPQPDIDKMQAELAELRRTVALLAEAIPKNQQKPTADGSQEQGGTATAGKCIKFKRARIH